LHIAKNAFNATIKIPLMSYVANNIITGLEVGVSQQKNLAIELSKSAAAKTVAPKKGWEEEGLIRG
jgi:hypothetical protein